jgi:hypothetical protein
MTPRQSIEAECARRGQQALVAGCIALLERRALVDDTLVDDTLVDDALLVALAGPVAEYVLSGREGGKNGYWPRVWAARGLLHAWQDRATAAIITATTDEAWRVREMAAKVVARHQVGDALDAVAALREDPVPRVRLAAERAVTKLTATGA